MDTRTGKIAETTDEFAKSSGERLTRLTNQEHELMKGLPEELRPQELALRRFVEDRAKLKAPCDANIRNGFRLGYQAAMKDRG